MNAPLRKGEFNWLDPDYAPVYCERMERLANLRANPALLPGLKAFYREDPAQFIDDWGMTYDPRMVEVGKDALMPFKLFKKQRDWVNWVLDHWRNRKPGATEKSRESGVSWLAIALGCTLCLFHNGMAIGFGSRKEEYVDKLESPKSLFFKARMFMRELPPEFRGSWNADRHGLFKRIVFPETASYLTGEAGDDIGRGDRTGIYFVDESAFLKSPEKVERALSQTTNCRMDISTPNGLGNPFEVKVHGGKIDVFTFHWRNDPRKNEEWYKKQCEELDPVTVAQEIDIDYSASVEGIVIPAAWVRAAIDAVGKIRDRHGVDIKVSGEKSGALDVADEGKDKLGFCGMHGVEVQSLQEWTGKGSDIFASVERAFALCDSFGYVKLRYDADGLGAGVRGDARIINETRRKAGAGAIEVEGHVGSGELRNPDSDDVVKGRPNVEYFKNRKAQAWWEVRHRFMLTYRWVEEGKECDPSDIISIPSNLPFCTQIVNELSQPTFSTDNAGKLLIDKKPDGAKSPNLADALVIRACRHGRSGVLMSRKFLDDMRRAAARRR